MKIKQHYLLNLKRRPERLYAWLGYQQAMGFDLPKLTVFEAVDGRSFEIQSDIANFAHRLNLQMFEHARNNQDTSLKGRGLLAETVSTALILTEIAKSKSDEYTVIWEDDAVLKIPYVDFVNINLPPDANIIAFDKFRSKSPHDQHLWDNREKKIHNKNFYNGIVGPGFLRCYAVNAQGATQILSLPAKGNYDGVMMNNCDIPHLYTYIPNIIRITWISGIASDTFSNLHAIQEWKVMSLKLVE